MKKNEIYIRVVLLLLIFGFIGIKAQEPKASIKIDTNNVLIGDPIKITYEFISPKDIKVTWPFIPDSFGRVEVLSKFKIDTTINQEWITQRQTISVTSFDSGNYIVPSMVFMYEKKGFTTLYPLQTDSIQLIFRTIDVDTSLAIKDIKPPLEEPFSIWDYIEYILIGLAIIVLGVVGYYLYKRFKKDKGEPKKIIPKIPPYITALEELKKLDNEKLWQNGFVKQYHTRLTEIIRQYLEAQFEVNAIEMTTSEIIESLKSKHFNDNHIFDLERLFELADLVKFAKFQPLPDENNLLMKLSVDFVNKTIPQDNLLKNNSEGKEK